MRNVPLIATILTINTVDATQAEVLDDLIALDQQLTQAERNLHQVQRKQSVLSQAVAQTKAELASAEISLEKSQDSLKKRIDAIYRQPSGLRLLLFARDQTIADFLGLKRALRLVGAHDRRLVEQHRTEQRKLQRLNREQQERGAELSRLEIEAKSLRTTTAERRLKRVALIETLARDPTSARSLYRGSPESRQYLASLFRSLQPLGRVPQEFARGKGRHAWPCVGRDFRAFGETGGGAYDTSVPRNGLDFAVKFGEPVRTIANGDVAFVGWTAGHGRVVIVDHGQEYHSLVSHLSKFEVREGQHVAQGEIIGLAGDTDSADGTSLYFEIRHRGDPIDPSPWLRPR